MSVSHCMGQALAIARTPRESWAHQIEQLQVGCGFADCGEPRSCRERIREYLRMQWRMAELRDKRQREKAGEAEQQQRGRR